MQSWHKQWRLLLNKRRHLPGELSCSSVLIPHVLGWELQVIRSAICGAYVHSFCLVETAKEIEGTNSEFTNDKPLCSLSCYRFTLIEGLTPDTVTSERLALGKKKQGAAEEGGPRVQYQGELPSEWCVP